AGLVGFGLSVQAATIPVTTTNPAPAADGQCSLIEAIINANGDTAYYADCAAGSGADVIELAPSATYVLDQVYANVSGPNGLPIINSDVTIEGRSSTIRRAAAAPEFRIFLVGSTGTFSLNDVTLENGAAGVYVGGALYNDGGVVTLNGSTVTGSSASGAGGIYNNSGTVTLTDSEVSFNTGTAGVGGLSSVASIGDAVVVIERSFIHGNYAIDSGAGGIYSVSGVSHHAELHISGSEISDNTTVYSGGGIRTENTVVTIKDSTFSGNHAGYFCAGLLLVGGSGDIDRTTFSGNTVGNTVDYGTGGGLCVSDNTTTISNCTISGNQVFGPSTGQFMSGRGGGLSLVGGAFGIAPTVDTVVVVEDSTICDNTAETVGGGISVYRYFGTMGVELQLRNTIIADNSEGGGTVRGNCAEGATAVINSTDFNLADDLTCNLVGTNDLVVADVMLSPLADNGGPTWTHLPEAGSPAVDSGDDLLCPLVDQNGNIRPWDGDGDGQVHCDRGAVELGAPFFADGFESGDTTVWSNAVP
ncbi:MAG: right-handed parallel beta-helix repeat-containing protein, partial [Candidatus Sulfomarinibacteraceae bacterium]